ncbi:MAG: GFA family protein [Rhodobacteraceae bacterium]|nr:GFA family protein [Paracoccaceae bacterium]
MVTGSCLCGAVGFEIEGDLPSANACHCTQCRKQSGHVWASTDVAQSALRLTREDGLCWYRSSENVRRGFCGNCGSFLFWDPATSDEIAVAMGALDTPTGGKLESHIFVAFKGDYYQIDDGLPQNQT